MNAMIYVVIALVAALLIGVVFRVRTRGQRSVPPQLRPGSPLPAFHATDEQGNPVQSSDLRGAPAVLLFVRGNWCPFCSRQVSDLTQYYRDITDLGARLVLMTPKPLETTRRVADFFKVDFDFWLDEDLSATRDLGLLLENGVPPDYNREYGTDTIWPTVIIVDADGIIRHTALCKRIADRPNPKRLLRKIRQALKT